MWENDKFERDMSTTVSTYELPIYKFITVKSTYLSETYIRLTIQLYNNSPVVGYCI